MTPIPVSLSGRGRRANATLVPDAAVLLAESRRMAEAPERPRQHHDRPQPHLAKRRGGRLGTARGRRRWRQRIELGRNRQDERHSVMFFPTSTVESEIRGLQKEEKYSARRPVSRDTRSIVYKQHSYKQHS